MDHKVDDPGETLRQQLVDAHQTLIGNVRTQHDGYGSFIPFTPWETADRIMVIVGKWLVAEADRMDLVAQAADNRIEGRQIRTIAQAFDDLARLLTPVRCSQCRRRGDVQLVDTFCAMPQPDGRDCQGQFVFTEEVM